VFRLTDVLIHTGSCILRIMSITSQTFTQMVTF